MSHETIQYPGWTSAIGIVAFAVSFAVFIWILVRALRMPKDKVDRLSRLPLNPDDPRRDER